MRKTQPVSVRMKPELKEELASLAEADRRSLSLYIEMVLEAHVEALKKKRKDRPPR